MDQHRGLFTGGRYHPVSGRIKRHRRPYNGGFLTFDRPVQPDSLQPLQLDE
jgi:hypothetical protein